MRAIISCIVAVLAALLGSGFCKCPSGYVQHYNSCYTFSRQTANWLDAKSYCKALGAELAIIKSADVNYFIVEHAKSLDRYGPLPGMGYFLDGTDLLQQGDWRWDTTGEVITYANWAPGEPNNHHIERCLMLYRQVNYGWNNIFCSDRLNFICETRAQDEHAIG